MEVLYFQCRVGCDSGKLISLALVLIWGFIIFKYYEETRGKTLEGIDEIFDGTRHTQVNTDVYQQFSAREGGN
jgi:hypothetical protein